jgi:hypothetical protein
MLSKAKHFTQNTKKCFSIHCDYMYTLLTLVHTGPLFSVKTRFHKNHSSTQLTLVMAVSLYGMAQDWMQLSRHEVGISSRQLTMAKILDDEGIQAASGQAKRHTWQAAHPFEVLF